MKIGLTYDLKEAIKPGHGLPDDALEEYDSPETVNGISSVLESLGHSVVRLGGGVEFLDNVRKSGVDIVFNISEGLGNYRSREAQVPSVLEMLDIPYVGSDPLCLAVSLDKSLTKKIIKTLGIPTPDWRVIHNQHELRKIDWQAFSFPGFVKPAQEGSSKGVRLNSRVDTSRQAEELIEKLLADYRQPVMIEEYVGGEEITVGITGNQDAAVLGIMRVLPRKGTGDFVYSLEVKRDWENLVTYECPAQLNSQVTQRITEYSLKIFGELGCRDFARVDFKVNRNGVPYFLEINPLAGLNPKSSDLPIMAGLLDIPYKVLIEKIFNAALDRYPNCVILK
jgi:D-alanine-D-alanine ligase